MFKKLKVIELASVLAGPSVGQFFAELGAEVIKIENPATQGDVTRGWLFKGEKTNAGVSSYFSSVNWGKKSVLLDIKAPKELKLLYDIVAQADVVIASYKPGDAHKLKVDYETLAAINPSLIYGHITGYGTDDMRVGYDAVIQAESGFMSINGEKNGDPLKMPVALIDVLAGHQLKQGLLVALIQQMTTGKGSYVPISLIDAAVSSLANQAANWLVGEMVPSRMGNQHPNIAPYGDVFKTQEGKQVILAVGNDKQFQNLNRVLGLTLDKEAPYASNLERVKNRDVLNQMLSEQIGSWQSGKLIQQLQKHQVPIGLIKEINEVFSEAPEHWLTKASKLQGVKTFMAMPQGFDSPKNLSAPPALGQHTLEVLKGLD